MTESNTPVRLLSYGAEISTHDRIRPHCVCVVRPGPRARGRRPGQDHAAAPLKGQVDLATGIGGAAPNLKSKDPKNPMSGREDESCRLRAPFATIVWDYINRGMPLNREGTLTPDEVYSLTACLLFINDVIPEDQALDQQSLPKVKMPIGDNYAALPEWKPRTKRLQGYPF
jgi:hypothetical protein